MIQSFKLYRLQQIDTNIDQSKARINKIDTILNDDKILNLAENDLVRIGNNLEQSQKELQKAENVVQDHQLKIEQTESSLYGGMVKNPKELQDLQNEAAALKRYRTVLEERLLEAMLIEEELEQEYSTAENKLKQIKIDRSKEHSELEQEKKLLKKEVDRLEDERQIVADSIPAPDLEGYKNLRGTRKGIAVAKVNDKSCSACGSTLSTSLLYDARSPSKISFCETCGRILYAG